jgi:hypothetical protein
MGAARRAIVDLTAHGVEMAAEAETCEIEITPEMIEAGIEEFCGFDSRFESDEDAVVRIFKAMITVTTGTTANCRRFSMRAYQA